MGVANVPGVPVLEGLRSMDIDVAWLDGQKTWEEARSAVPPTASEYTEKRPVGYPSDDSSLLG
jgi:hypothetical protein